MRVDFFKKMAVDSVARAIRAINHDNDFEVYFGESTDHLAASDCLALSASVNIKFNAGGYEKAHKVIVCWRQGWGVGLLKGDQIKELTFDTIIKEMYLDLALS